MPRRSTGMSDTAAGPGAGRRRRRRAQPHGRADAGLAQRGPLVGAPDRARLAVRAMVRRRLGGARAGPADAGAGPPDRRGAGRRRDRAGPRHGDLAARCCATTTTCSRSGPAPRTCRCRSCWTAQFYRLAHWRVGDEELNYRRFFDIDTLAGVRVEDPQVFAETPRAAARPGRTRARSTGCGSTTPTGSPTRAATCGGCRGDRRTRGSSSRRSSRATRQLPADWPCAGTTGYDALLRRSAGCSSTQPGCADARLACTTR